jgi:hypothetical protein
MNAQEFAVAQHAFASRLARLKELRPSVVSDDIDVWIKQVSSVITGDEETAPFLVTHIEKNNRKLLDNMRRHVLENVPSDALFSQPYDWNKDQSDKERTGRYELVGGLMVESGFPAKLLYSGRRWEEWRFKASSTFFRARAMPNLNEQCIASWARRLLCFYGPISDVRVLGQELRDRFATRNNGKTTLDLFRSELEALQRGTY